MATRQALPGRARSSSTATAALPARRGGRARARDLQRQVRRLGRGPPPPRRRPPPRRPDGPRHRRAAARHRQGRPRRRVRPGREGPGGAARRRRRGRRRGPRQEDRGRLARVRRRDRDPGHDGPGRSPRPDPRPPRPHAEPQGRHRSRSTSSARSREVKGGRVEFKVDKGAIVHVPVGRASFEADQLAENLAGARRRGQPRQAGRRQGPVPADADDRDHDGPGHPGRHPGRPRGRAVA